MTAIRVSPTLPPNELTHHIALRDRNGKQLGLILCDSQGKISPQFNITTLDRTALKTTTGASTYSDFQYPYSPITQDDWEGGRANLDFERDSTRFYDSFRMRTGRANKAFHGPQEQWTTGYRSINQATPGNVNFHELTDTSRIIAKRFQASANYTAALAWIIAKRKGEPADLTIAIYSDSAGNVGTSLTSATVADTRMADVLSEWLSEAISYALTSGTYYWIVITASEDDDSDNHWSIGVSGSSGTTYYSDGTTYTSATFDLYYRLTPANTSKTAIFFEYKDGQYMVVSGESGAPNLYINGDRGTADSNVGQLTKLIDATKSWTTNQWAGCIVLISDGTGRLEPTPYRTIVSNTGTEITLDTAWTITHDTTTEYIILGANTWTEITGHGLTAPVTDVLVSTRGVIYFAQGDSTNIQRMQFATSAGVWTQSQAADGTNKAVFLAYKQQGQKIIKANNSDGSTNVSVAQADPVDWGTNLTFASAVNVGSKYRRITGLEVYPDLSGNEAVWVMKVDQPWIAPTSGTSLGTPYPYNLPEMETVRSTKNGAASLVHSVYLYFSLGNGLERYYGGNLDDVGPNREEGLPTDRQGPIVAMIGYPGKYFAVVDAGASGYSSILTRESNGWHEHYRAPKGQRIRAMGFQPIPGATLDRMWVYQGNDVIWLPFPSDTTNELQDSAYLYTHEAALVLSRMHAGMFDVQKVLRYIKIQSDNLARGAQYYELDYRLNEDEAWTPLDEKFEESPTQRIDLIGQYGLIGKRLQFRIRSYTTNASISPILLAFIAETVIRTTVKNQYGITFRLMDDAHTLTGSREPEKESDPMAILKQLQDWADDSSEGGLLEMESSSRLFHKKMVFLNPINVQQLSIKPDPEKDGTAEIFVCTTSLQDA